MDVISHVALSRQQGLKREMDAIANNIANMSTTGYRREGVIFSEHVEASRGGPSVSFGHARTRYQEDVPGVVNRTGGTFDLAIDGEGYFQIETEEGERMVTRAGAFTLDPAGQVVTPTGERLLDAAGAAILIPPGAGDIAIASDGSVSAGGDPIAQIGLFDPVPDAPLERVDGVSFRSAEPFVPRPDGQMRQGFVESSNVSPVWEMTRMIEVQRAYEFNQSLLDREDDRVRDVIRTLGSKPT